MLTRLVALHFPIPATTVYVVLPVGVPTGSRLDGSSRVTEGDQLNFKPSPVACRLTGSVRQIVLSGSASSVTKSTTRTRMESVLMQPRSLSVTKYFVVIFG